ncbi:glycosyltransferase family 2 protein [Pseudobutyrivibrio sp.]
MKKLDILIPQYKETEEVLAPLLKSIDIQQNVDLKNDIGVIICNDGSDVKLSDDFLNQFTFDVTYLQNEHKGVSAARNACLDASTADYVMFCDADDMFYNMCGLWIVFREMEGTGFNALMSVFVEETKDPKTGDKIYINREQDSTFVHGKVYRRSYLTMNKLRFNDALTIHEDSYFNCLAQRLSGGVKYCQVPFYLWRWRDESVCRHDPKYILKTYNNMLDSSTALCQEFLRRNRKQDAEFYATSMIYDAYYMMNKDEWLNQENQEYRMATEKRFQRYYFTFKELFDTIPEEIKNQIIVGMRNRFFQEGMFMESVTFGDWIKHIESLKGGN